MSADIEIRPLCAAGGAEIRGIDLSKELSNEEAEAIHSAFLEHIAIWFPEQQLDPADLTRLITLFGEPFVHPYLHALDGFPYVHELRKTPDQTVNFGRGWHADWTFLEKPSLANMLYSRIVPDSGGDTMFVNTYMAYEALSPGMKRMLGGMRAVHKVHPRYYTDVDAMGNRRSGVVDQETMHPVVRTHPETSRKALYINPSFVKRFEDMTEEESRGNPGFHQRASELPGIPVPLPLETGHARHLGQPLLAALRAERLHRPIAPDAPPVHKRTEPAVLSA